MTYPAAMAAPARRPGVVLALLAVIAGASALGDAAAMVTLTIRLYDAEHAAWAITALLFAILGPSVALAPLAARILARVPVWPALVVTSAVQAATATVLAMVSATGPTLALVVVLGAGLALTQPALLSVVPALVGRDRVVWANSLTRTANWSGWTVGPIIGGALCAAGAASAALLIEAALFVVAGACFVVLNRMSGAAGRTRDPHVPATADPGSVPEDRQEHSARRRLVPPTIRAALGYVRRDRTLETLLLAVGIINLCTFMTGVAEVFFARDVLHTGDTGYAALLSVWSASMVAGNLLAPRAARRGARRAAVLGLAMAGAGLAAAAMAPSLPTAMAAYAVAGAGSGLQYTLVRSMIQRRADGPLCAPVCAVWVAIDMGTQLAGFVAGGVAMAVGARFTLLAAGAGLCSVSILGAVRARRSAPRAARSPVGPGPEPAPAAGPASISPASHGSSA